MSSQGVPLPWSAFEIFESDSEFQSLMRDLAVIMDESEWNPASRDATPEKAHPELKREAMKFLLSRIGEKPLAMLVFIRGQLNFKNADHKEEFVQHWMDHVEELLKQPSSAVNLLVAAHVLGQILDSQHDDDGRISALECVAEVTRRNMSAQLLQILQSQDCVHRNQHHSKSASAL